MAVGGASPCRGTHDDRYHCVNLHRNPSALPGSDMGWCIADRWQITWGTFKPTLTFSPYCCGLNVPSSHARVYDLRDVISLGWLKFHFRYEVCVIWIFYYFFFKKHVCHGQSSGGGEELLECMRRVELWCAGKVSRCQQRLFWHRGNVPGSYELGSDMHWITQRYYQNLCCQTSTTVCPSLFASPPPPPHPPSRW